MKQVRHFSVYLIMVSLLFALAACKTSSSEESEAIPYPIPAKSKFAQIQLGWSYKRVHDTIGEPTETRSYTTGKAFIPFYFGSDSGRMEDLYKGEGRIIYAGGTGMGSQGFTVLKIIYNPNESGYNDKQAFPDGPQNTQPKKKTAKKNTAKSTKSTEPNEPKTAAPSADTKNDPLGGL